MGFKQRALVIFTILNNFVLVHSDQPKAATENGVVVGTYKTSYSGFIYESFEGIPYAKPPVSDYRFKEPQPLEKKWLGEWNATAPGSRCLQWDHFTKTKNDDGSVEYGVVGDEDCLFINVYTRDSAKANKDVIIHIHGGAFMFGFGDRYGPDYLMDHDDVIFVTFNYRLGPLGFLSTGDSVIPGNNGLKDQVAALSWVQRNIKAFGGDPSKVTIAGLSAGGASVYYMYLSPLANGLFNRGYSFSGSPLCPWAFVNDVPQKTRHLAALLGCPTSNSESILKCLKGRPARQMVQQMKHFQVWLYNPFSIFGPVVEKGAENPFMDQKPIDIIKQGKAKNLPWLAGVTSEEGLYPVAEFITDDSLLTQLNDNYESIASSLLFFNDTHPLKFHFDISEKMKKAYFQGEAISSETTKELVQMTGDRAFVAPVVENALLHARHNSQPVYMYRFAYRSGKSVSVGLSKSKKVFGVAHADDLAYVLKIPLETRASESDEKIGKILEDILLTFSKTGKVPTALSWSPLSSSGPVQYLEVSSPEKLTMKTETIGNIYELRKIFSENFELKDEL